MVDYALRRRFAFNDTQTTVSKVNCFQKWLIDRGMNDGLVGLIVDRMVALNQEITDDPLLGEITKLVIVFFLSQRQ